MAKVEIAHNGVLRFEELTTGDFFIYNGELYLKIDISGETDNAFNFQDEYFGTFDGGEIVTEVDSKLITIKVN